MVRGKAAVPLPATEPECIACKRRRSVVKVGRLEYVEVKDLPGFDWLCSDPADCRRHWASV